MSATRIRRHVKAPRAAVHRALLDREAIAAWKVPEDVQGRPPVSAWGLDTTTALRLLTGRPSAQAEKAKDFVIRARRTGEKTYISDPVVAEAYHALQFHYGVPKKVARRQMLAMLSSGLVLPEADGHARQACSSAPAVT